MVPDTQALIMRCKDLNQLQRFRKAHGMRENIRRDRVDVESAMRTKNVTAGKLRSIGIGRTLLTSESKHVEHETADVVREAVRTGLQHTADDVEEGEEND